MTAWRQAAHGQGARLDVCASRAGTALLGIPPPHTVPGPYHANSWQAWCVISVVESQLTGRDYSGRMNNEPNRDYAFLLRLWPESAGAFNLA
jgi:hypothetical protein